MYTVTIIRHGRKQTAQFDYEWQAAQFAEMFLDNDAVMRDPSGKVVPLFADSNDSEL